MSSDSPVPETHLLKTTVFLLLLAWASALADDSTTPTAEKRIDPSIVDAGEWSEVNIIVHGFSQTEETCVPFDAVLLIDQSGSMDGNDPSDHRIDGANAFVARAANENCDIRIGVVSFSDAAQVQSPLTDDYAHLTSRIAGLASNENGMTNLAAGMADSQGLFAATAPGRAKAIVLLTDGEPMGQQTGPILDLVNQAVGNDIVYYTIGLGDANIQLLEVVADITGGEFCTIASIVNCYNNFFDRIAFEMVARNLWVRERVDPSLRIRVGSLSLPAGLDPLDPGDEQAFYSSGVLNYRLGTLPSNRERSFSFDVTPRSCGGPDTPLGESFDFPVDSEDPSDYARIEFSFGTSPNTIAIPIEQRILTCRNIGFSCKKTVDPATRRVSIELQNAYAPHPTRSNSVSNIKMTERVHRDFEIDKASVRFDGACDLRPQVVRVVPPTPKPRETMQYPWNLIGNPTYDSLAFRMTTLAPLKQCTVSFDIISRACDETDSNPFAVNLYEKRKDIPVSSVLWTSPTGETHECQINQKEIILPQLDACSGRADVYIDPPFRAREFHDAPVIFALPASNLPLRVNLVPPGPAFDSESIWIDSATNGLVDDWSNATQIEERLSGFEGLFGSGVKVAGQGDVFSTGTTNRVCVQLSNAGSADAQYQPQDKIVVSAYRQLRTTTPPIALVPIGYEEVASAQMPSSIPNREYEVLCLNLPDNTMTSSYLTNHLIYFKVTVPIADLEMHRNNNEAVEVVRAVN